jgi:hypothetical protein
MASADLKMRSSCGSERPRSRTGALALIGEGLAWRRTSSMSSSSMSRSVRFFAGGSPCWIPSKFSLSFGYQTLNASASCSGLRAFSPSAEFRVPSKRLVSSSFARIRLGRRSAQTALDEIAVAGSCVLLAVGLSAQWLARPDFRVAGGFPELFCRFRLADDNILLASLDQLGESHRS